MDATMMGEEGHRALSPRLVQLANRLIAFGTGWLVMEGLFALHLGRSARVVGLWLVAAAALFVVRLRLAPETRLRAGLFLLLLIIGVHGFELRMGLKRPPPATAAAIAGRAWDNRSMAEVVDDLRATGRSASPLVQPKPIYLLERGPLRTPAGELMPLGGISGETTVFCNEGGAWSIFEADERGFVNPKGAFSRTEIELGLVGDSFTQGACVRSEESHAGLLRARHPSLINLGMGGNGPLIELAGIREYLSRIKPKRVLWFYFRNDLDDLNAEQDVPLLMKYLEPGFSQGLFDRQAAIDEAERALVARHAPYSKRWPPALASIGVSRARTPVWLQDLALAERNSALSALLRLDSSTSLLEFKAAGRPPDFELFKNVLRRAKADVAAWSGELTFVYLPDLWFTGTKVKPHPLRARVLEAVREVALPLLDIDAPFNAEPDLEALRYHPDAHTSPAGYAVIARVLNAYLDGLAR